MSSENTTPMLRQYHAVKAEHKDCILLFRLGDFYEMFFEDAQVVAHTLDLVLTSRGKTPSGKIPMCGFPHHAADNYISRLIKAGYKVAICEQLEDPALAKGIVKRDVTRIITSGTFLDENSTAPRYIVAVNPTKNSLGLSFIDPTTGTLFTNQYPADEKYLINTIGRLAAYECIFPESAQDAIKKTFQHPLLKLKGCMLSAAQDWSFNADIARKSLCEHFGVRNLHGFGIEDMPDAIAATGALLEYVRTMNKQPLKHIDKISLFADDDYAYISPAAHRGLELDSLIRTIDATVTPLGKRALYFWFYHPLKNTDGIRTRQDAITRLTENPAIQKRLHQLLEKVPDIEKNISRLSCGYTHAKDLLALRNTLARIPEIQKAIEPLVAQNELFTLADIPDLREHLIRAVNEDIPLSHPEGNIIAPGFNAEIDALRDIQENGSAWLKKLQKDEIKRTGITSLKVGFNKVFGYYIEVTNTKLSSVPQDYIRKQTLVNGERFITPQLKEYEEKLLTAQDKILKLETALVAQVREFILAHSLSLHLLCDQLATLDVLYSLSVLAATHGYTLPDVTNDTRIDIKNGRHPVVEKAIAEPFIPNDTVLNCADNHLIILTGPNMAGKSTYIRQTAVLVIMAQVGSFIPAKAAHIGIVDKIFTRIGAHDDITKGQSTFMVEMNEAADILNNMTSRSLIILDEIGRGTSTYDGLSLAWALAEHLHQTKARTLFATHFHELTALADEHAGIKNYNVAVKEWKDEIIFLHKIIEGSTDDSYGIYVAKLAGIPHSVISRAKNILTKLELHTDLSGSIAGTGRPQLDLFSSANDPIADEIKETLAALDINNLTPLAALEAIHRLKEKAVGK